MKIGIIGNGYVGKATSNIIPDEYEKIIYDSTPEKCEPAGTTFEDLNGCNLIFVCVPTPMNRRTKHCHTNIVESVIQKIRKELKTYSGITIRSTVPVGTSHSLDVHFMPEFLTEANWEKDILETTDWIVGHDDVGDKDFSNSISKLINDSFNQGKIANNNIHFTSTKTAELTKYTSNGFFATKVAFFNEIYSFCQVANIDFEEMRAMLINSCRGRISESHTKVPGPDGKTGFGGTCLPKDLYAIQHSLWEKKIDPIVMRAVEVRNRTRDRKEQDWMDDEGRAAIR